MNGMGRIYGVIVAMIAMAMLFSPAAVAQTKVTTGNQPGASVLLFPAVFSTPEGGTAPVATALTRETQEIVTDALRRNLTRNGASITVYDLRLPSIQRSVSEGTLKREDAAAGPGDDPRKAQRLADIAGAAEYVLPTIDNYKFDPETRTATFNLSVFRNATADGSPLGTAAVPAQGIAPADVAPARQPGSATARAAAAAAEQVATVLYPQAPKQVVVKEKPHHKRGEKLILLGVVIGIGLLIIKSTR